MERKTILLTGFGLWGDHQTNSSWLLASTCKPTLTPGWSLKRAQLPVVWTEAWPRLSEEIDESTAAVVLTGMCGPGAIRLERIALNFADQKLADASGKQATSERLVTDGPAGYFSSLPLEAMLGALKQAKLPARISPEAGQFICNSIFYTAVHHLRRKRPDLPIGFVHIPPEGNKEGHLSEAALKLAGNAVVEAVCAALNTRWAA